MNGFEGPGRKGRTRSSRLRPTRRAGSPWTEAARAARRTAAVAKAMAGGDWSWTVDPFSAFLGGGAGERMWGLIFEAFFWGGRVVIWWRTWSSGPWTEATYAVSSFA